MPKPGFSHRLRFELVSFVKVGCQLHLVAFVQRASDSGVSNSFSMSTAMVVSEGTAGNQDRVVPPTRQVSARTIAARSLDMSMVTRRIAKDSAMAAQR